MCHSLMDERGEWQQRIRAVLYHRGLPRRSDLDLLTAAGRDWLTELSLSAATHEQITIGLQMIAALDTEIPAIDKQLRAYARCQTGCRALMSHYGIGELTSVAILAELGDCRRFSSSRYAVRYGGLEMLASNCTSCSGDFGLRDVAGVRDPFAAVLLDLGVERDPQAVAGVAVGGELVV